MIEIILVIVPMLIAVAFMTIIERKVMASTQRRIGPNMVGYYGVMQPFADALKLIIKETVVPQNASKFMFFLAPFITIVCSLLGWAVIPFGSGLTIVHSHLDVIYSLAVSSLGIYGILLAGWSANSKYAFLGSIRSTAQRISYELILGTAILIVCICAGSFNYYDISLSQLGIWFFIPLLPVFIIFLIAMLAETNRTPFDLPEAESELVAGFFTEHSAMPFVLYFLAEYCSIIVISVMGSIFFLGGPIVPHFINITYLPIEAIILGVKTSLFCFFFVWVRATLPRLRYDQLMQFCWIYLIPAVIALLLFYPILISSSSLYV